MEWRYFVTYPATDRKVEGSLSEHGSAQTTTWTYNELEARYHRLKMPLVKILTRPRFFGMLLLGSWQIIVFAAVMFWICERMEWLPTGQTFFEMLADPNSRMTGCAILAAAFLIELLMALRYHVHNLMKKQVSQEYGDGPHGFVFEPHSSLGSSALPRLAALHEDIHNFRPESELPDAAVLLEHNPRVWEIYDEIKKDGHQCHKCNETI